MTDIARSLRSYGGIPIQTAKRGDIVRHRGTTFIVEQAYPDGSVRGNLNARSTVVDHGDWQMVSACIPVTPEHVQ